MPCVLARLRSLVVLTSQITFISRKATKRKKITAARAFFSFFSSLYLEKIIKDYSNLAQSSRFWFW
jgi:hypothetical protein